MSFKKNILSQSDLLYSPSNLEYMKQSILNTQVETSPIQSVTPKNQRICSVHEKSNEDVISRSQK
ncbi:UNKNOWN [Stylonychia lemnae]|uniref:Uncharacterized protein n=1 Tax=Stylonychia lemnae TaxID=5949 RepID=A0A078B0M8_STYLE|nr:UNKNOWN [Stylonychia lemnae]|eukprot:CDW86668.1 UNKNOWN [Stylonychia lemnae]